MRRHTVIVSVRLLRAGVATLFAGLLIACGASPTPNPANPNNPAPSPGTEAGQLRYGSQAFPLTNGLLEYFGTEAYHYNSEIGATDGAYVPIPITIYVGGIPISYLIWVASDATVDVFAEIYTAGDAFAPGLYTFVDVPEDGPGRPSLAGQNYFAVGYVATDSNGDGEIDEDEEIEIKGGTIAIAGTPPNLSYSVDLQLANGQRAKGTFSGEVLVVDE